MSKENEKECSPEGDEPYFNPMSEFLYKKFNLEGQQIEGFYTLLLEDTQCDAPNIKILLSGDSLKFFGTKESNDPEFGKSIQDFLDKKGTLSLLFKTEADMHTPEGENIIGLCQTHSTQCHARILTQDDKAELKNQGISGLMVAHAFKNQEISHAYLQTMKENGIKETEACYIDSEKAGELEQQFDEIFEKGTPVNLQPLPEI